MTNANIEKVVFNKSNACIIASVTKSKLVRGNWVTKELGTWIYEKQIELKGERSAYKEELHL